jgi:hypothetical protein
MKGVLRSVDALDSKQSYWAAFFFVETHPVVEVLGQITPKHIVVTIEEPFAVNFRGSLIAASNKTGPERFPAHVSVAVKITDLPAEIRNVIRTEVTVRFSGVTRQTKKLLATVPH